MYRLTAINISDNIDIKIVRDIIEGRIIVNTISELFIKTQENKYITVFNNGVISFCNYTDVEMRRILNDIRMSIKNPQENISESINIELTDQERVRYENNVLYVSSEYDGSDLLRIVMYDLSQTVGIDYYSKISENLLAEVEKFATQLEKKGKISLSNKEMNKFIGKSLSTKNKIVSNLYIFDTPDMVWEKENLEIVHKVLTRTFDLNARIKELQSTFDVIDDNLEMFKRMYEHKHSAFLENIVIVLILIEILKSFAEKFNIF